MANESSRVPTPPASGWSIETALDHILAMISSNDKRYEERFEASEKALALGFSAQKDAVASAFDAQKDAVNAALASADRAVQKAEASAEKRFESVNEFRSTLADQQRNLIPRSEVAVMITAMDAKVNALEKVLDKIEAERVGVRGGWGYAVGVAGLVLVLLGVIAAVAAFVARQG